jgi:hypothetical protein
VPKKFVRSNEPLLAPNFSQEDIDFYKWLAGFVDGDACFYFYEKRNETSLQIKQATWNLHLLEQLKGKFGGSIRKITDGGKQNSHHYSLAQRDRLIELLHGVNGYIRATSRTVQFKKFCDLYNITYIEPNFLKPNDPYLAGMFDADGSINLYNTDSKKGRGLTISMSARYKEDIECYKDIFNGNITTRPTRDCSDWQISAQEDVLFAQGSLVKYVRSNKLIRLKLVPLFYELREIKAYQLNSPFLKDWEDLIESWYDNGADFYRKDCKGRPYTEQARRIKELKDNLDK